jgi:heme/copper-type cytochrome/quinol oxidase subunit 2
MQRTNNLFRLGYSILVGPIVWAVHFMTVWIMSEFGCRANFNNVLFYPPGTIRTAIIVATVLALVLVSIGAVLAVRGWGRLNGTARPANDAQETTDYLTVTGFLMSSLFLFIIFVSAMPNFILNVCDKVL